MAPFYIYIYVCVCVYVYIYMCVCVCVCIYIYIYIYFVTLLLLLAGGKILIWNVMHLCVCISVVLDSTFKVWKYSVCYCRIDEIDVLILIFVLINCIHLMSCAGAMMWMSCGVV